ncbi:MAG: hypothetical protein D8M54_21575, partial [Chloroflexi bacterium]|nr:hypothetical protein [Chloroflexota bacterium]
RQRLLTAMVSLLPTEEVTQMVERLLEESETLLLDTPYLRQMRVSVQSLKRPDRFLACKVLS